MASYQKLSDSKWFIRIFSHRNAAGKQIFYNETYHGTAKQRDVRIRELQNRKSEGKLFQADTETLNQHLDKWLKDVAPNGAGERTLQDYSEYLKRYVREPLGEMGLLSIKPEHVQKVFSDMHQRGLSPRTIQFCYTILRAALKDAVWKEKILFNVAERTKRPEVRSKPVRVLTSAEVEKFIDAASEDSQGAALTFAVATGARPEEYTALDWQSLNLEEGTVRITKVLHWARKGGGYKFTEQPKTDAGRRTLYLSPTLTAILAAHRKRQLEHKLAVEKPYRHAELVFASSEGCPLHQRNLYRRHMRCILKRACLDTSLSLYTLRHTFATLGLAADINPKLISNALGHTKVAFTLDTYCQVLEPKKRFVSQRIRELLFAGLLDVEPYAVELKAVNNSG